MLNPFLFLFCARCFMEAISVSITMTNGSYTQSCLITGISPWHLQIKYFLPKEGTFVTAVLDGTHVTDVMVFTKQAQLVGEESKV